MSDTSITTMRTARLGLPYLFPGQSQKEVFVNEGFARLDALVQAGVLGVALEPPADPADGACYLVADGATADWHGHDGAIAVRAAGQWLFQPAVTGTLVFDRSRQCFLRADDEGAWIALPSPTVPSGGSVQDSELRDTVSAIVAKLRQFGIFT